MNDFFVFYYILPYFFVYFLYYELLTSFSKGIWKKKRKSYFFSFSIIQDSFVSRKMFPGREKNERRWWIKKFQKLEAEKDKKMMKL
jgi:hypothetical protein